VDVVGVAVLLGEEEGVDEMRAGTTSMVAMFSGRWCPEARAISRWRSCCGDGFGLVSSCAIADAIKRPTMSARSNGTRGGQWNQRGGETRPVLIGIDCRCAELRCAIAAAWRC
jgi:hypothetical protein